MRDPKTYIHEVLVSQRKDLLPVVWQAFRGMSYPQMLQNHDGTAVSRFDYLRQSLENEQELDAALEWLSKAEVSDER